MQEHSDRLEAKGCRPVDMPVMLAWAGWRKDLWGWSSIPHPHPALGSALGSTVELMETNLIYRNHTWRLYSGMFHKAMRRLGGAGLCSRESLWLEAVLILLPAPVSGPGSRTA